MKKALLQLIALLLLLGSHMQAQSAKINLDCGEVLYETTIGKKNNFNSSHYSNCNSSLPFFDGPDQVFRIKKENDSGRLSISLFNESKEDLDIFLLNKSLEDCIDLSIEPNSGNENIETIIEDESPLPAGTYYLVVDGYDSDQAADFSISATCGKLNPIYLTKLICGKKVESTGNLDYPNDVSAYKIGNIAKGGNTGPERIFYFDLFFSDEVTIELDNFLASDNFELFLLSELDEFAGIAYSTNPIGQKEEITIALEPGRYFVVVEGYNATMGSFDLFVDWDCRENAETGSLDIECGEVIEGNTVGFKNDFEYNNYATCLEGSFFNGYEYNDALYRFDLEDTKAIQIELEILSPFLDLDIFLLESIYESGNLTTPLPGACIAASTDGSGNGNYAAIFNDLRPGTYWIAVDGGLEGLFTGALPSNEGFFNLNLNCFDLPAPCDLNGEFIANGNTIFQSTADTLSGIYFKGISCIENQYSVSELLQGKVFTYYSKETTNTTVNIESQSPEMNVFVFACDGTPRDYSCIMGTNSSNKTITFTTGADQYYQLIVLNGNSNTSFKLSIPTPSGPCSNDIPQIVYPGFEINSTVAGAGNDFNASKSPFFQNCSSGDFSYDGEDRVFQIGIQFDSGNEVDFSNVGPHIQGGVITLEAPTAMGLFLFNYQCGGQNCIAKIELPPGGGTASLHLADYVNKAGTYYLVLDKATNSGSSSFLLRRSDPIIFVVDCDDVTEDKHIVNFASNVLSGQHFMTTNDKIFIDYENKIYNSETLYVPYDVVEINDNTNDISPVILLEQDTLYTNDSSNGIAKQKCGFKSGENFVFKLLKADGQVILLDPIFDDSPIFAAMPLTFKPGETTFVKEFRVKNTERSFKLDFEPDNVNLNGLPYSSSSFEAHVDANSYWTIQGLLVNNWIKIYSAQNGAAGIPLAEGEGAKKILVQVDANPNNEVRQGVFEIVAENGFAQRVKLTQLPNPCGAAQFNITEQITDVSCKGHGTGGILLTDGDGMSFDYQWEDGAIGANRTDLVAGSYQVLISDQTGCATMLEYTVQEPAEPLTLQLEVQAQEVCPGATTAATVLFSGGVPDYNVQWSDGTTGLANDNLLPGNYSVTLTDGNECTQTELFQIEESEALQPQVVGTPELCQGEQTTLDAGAFAGYLWSTGATSRSIPVSTPGAYEVTVTDQSGCVGEDVFSVTVNENPQPSISGADFLCFGEVTTLSVNGAFSQYVWSNGAVQSSTEVSTSGTYQVSVTDENGCGGTAELALTVNPEIELEEEVQHISCFGSNDGQIKVEANGGTGNLSYRWEPDLGSSSALDGLPPGVYELMVIDENDCQEFGSLEITEPAPLSLSIDSIRHVGGDTLGFITVETFGGIAPYTYYWTWPGGFRQTNHPNSGALPVGAYEVKVEDGNGCSYTLNATIVPTRKVFFENASLKVYPNPGKGHFFLEWDAPIVHDMKARIVNVVGEIISEFTILKAKQKELLNLENQPSGVYFLHLNNQRNYIIRKIIVE